MEHNELDEERAQDTAERCLQDTMRASDTEATGAEACETLPIFASGSDVPEATEHDLKAIAPVTGNPAWIMLNYESRQEKEAGPYKPGWYEEYACKGEGKVTACDEYPFYSTEQAGPGASLEVIDWSDNSRQGGLYGNFASLCGLVVDGKGAPFLAIPLTPALGIPTQRICNR